MKYILIIIIALLFSATNNFNCSQEKPKQNIKNPKQTELNTIEEVLKQHTPYLMTIPGVVGTAIGECDGELCIKVLVKTLSEEMETKIPQSIQGYMVIIEEVGDVRAF